MRSCRPFAVAAVVLVLCVGLVVAMRFSVNAAPVPNADPAQLTSAGAGDDPLAPVPSATQLAPPPPSSIPEADPPTTTAPTTAPPVTATSEALVPTAPVVTSKPKKRPTKRPVETRRNRSDPDRDDDRRQRDEGDDGDDTDRDRDTDRDNDKLMRNYTADAICDRYSLPRQDCEQGSSR